MAGASFYTGLSPAWLRASYKQLPGSNQQTQRYQRYSAPKRSFCSHGYPVGAFDLLMVAAVGHANEILHGPFLSSAHRHTMNLASNRQLPGCG